MNSGVQINLLEDAPEQNASPKKTSGTKWSLVTAILQIGGGLAFGGYEWHEKYLLCSTVSFDSHGLLEALSGHHLFKGARLVTKPFPMLVAGETQITMAQAPIQSTLAKLMLEHKVIPLIKVGAKEQAA